MKLSLILILVLSLFLRLFKLSEVPPSLYWDEVSLGYNAYSILLTGQDEHQKFLPFDAFAAFGDQKPPVYIYSIIPFVKLLGLGDLAVRIPSAIAGFLLVIVTYLIAKLLFKKSRWIAVLSAFLISVSPWSLQHSRAGFEANFSSFLDALGIYFALKALLYGRKIFFFIATFCLAATFYTFNSNRLFTPLILCLLIVVYRRNVIKLRKYFLFAALLFGLLLAPLLSHLFSKEGQLRYQEVNIFSDVDIVRESNKLIDEEGNSLFSKIIHNRRISYFLIFLKHYFDHFDFRFLFLSGDVNPRLSSQSTGELYLIDLPLVLSGIYYLIKLKNRAVFVLIPWFLLALIPAGVARETPHALRILNALPTPQIIEAFGIYSIFKAIQNRGTKKVLGIIFFLLYSLNISYYLHNYYVHYPREHANDWMYGYKQAALYIERNSQLKNNYDRIFVTDVYGRPYIYFLFYLKFPPSEFWKYKDQTAKSVYGVYFVGGFDKFEFGNFDFGKETGRKEKVLYILHTTTALPIQFKTLDLIYGPDGKPIFIIGDLENVKTR